MRDIDKPAAVGIASFIMMFVVLFAMYYLLPSGLGDWKPTIGISSAVITWIGGMVICYKVTKVE